MDAGWTPLTEPVLSVVIIAPKGYALLRCSVAHYREQCGAEGIEVVITVPRGAELRVVDTDFDGLHGYRVVEVAEGASIGDARAAGVRASRAAVVVFGEDHSYPEPGWAAALIKRHLDGYAAVGPAIANANSGSATSWAQLFMTYGGWVAPAAAGEPQDLPGHNSSYKREALLPYGDELAVKLRRETLLHTDLLRRGERLFLEPRAVTRHVNVSSPYWIVVDHVVTSRLQAAARALDERWGRGRRLGHAVAQLWCFLPRLAWSVKKMKRAGQGRRLARVWPVMAVATAAGCVGEALGAVAGPGSERLVDSFEFDRGRFLTRRDQADLRALEAAAEERLAAPREAVEATAA